ncbi:MAG: FAD-dependent oxidoreductase [Planctomycetota bacterium]
MTSGNLHEPARETPVLGTWDVVVCGGGAAGCAAALGAARHGARVLLVEKDGYLGGATVSQLVAHILSTNAVDFQGVWHTWIRAIRRRRADAVAPLVHQGAQWRSGVDPEVVKFAWDDLFAEAGVDQLLHACVAGAAVEDGRCTAVLVETKAGRRALRTARAIDCTGDGILAAAAGVPWDHGQQNGEPWNQALTKVFRMGNVAWPAGGLTEEAVTAAREAIRAAVERGEFTSPVVANGRAIRYGTANYVHHSVVPYRTEMNVFPSRVLQVDPLDPFDLTRAEREGRDQAWQSAEALRRYAPGFEAAYLLDTNAHIGLRDSRRIRGIATATADDVWNLVQRADGIARSSWNIDIWPGDSYDNAAVPHGEATYEAWKTRIQAGEYFGIPYGAIVAREIDGFLVAGRCLSAEREAQASLRIQQTCMATGEAAGVAAALSLREGVPPRELDPALVVRQLAADRDVEPAFDNLRDIPVAPRKEPV